MQELRLTDQELLTDLSIQNDQFELNVDIPLPDASKGHIATQSLRISSFTKTATTSFEFENLNMFRLLNSGPLLSQLLQSHVTFNISCNAKVLCEGKLPYHDLFFTDGY